MPLIESSINMSCLGLTAGEDMNKYWKASPKVREHWIAWYKLTLKFIKCLAEYQFQGYDKEE
jgi:hypothetical protein